MGCWVRSLAFHAGHQFWPILAGTAIYVLALPMCTNAISLIANLWFSDDQRATATSLISLSMPLGTMLSLLITGLIAAGLDDTDAADCLERIREVTLVQNVIISTLALLTLILFREKPTYPPSKLAMVKREITKDGLGDDIRVLRQNGSYLGNAWVFVVIWGTYGAVGNLLTPFFGSQYSPSQISMIGGAFVFFGVMGTTLVGIVIDKTKAYLFIIRVISTACATVMFAALWIVPSGNLALTLLFACALGFFMTPILPAGYSFSVHLTHPLPPAVSNGLMMIGA